jgi:NADH-quinone oxidoreductase subunit H
MTLLEQFQLWLGGIWPEWAAYLVPAIVGIVVILAFIVVMVIVFIYFFRRVLGRFQIRIGPNRLGPEGIFQPIATAVKILCQRKVIKWFTGWRQLLSLCRC